MNSGSKWWLWALIALALVVCCCIMVACVGLVGYSIFKSDETSVFQELPSLVGQTPTPSLRRITPTPPLSDDQSVTPEAKATVEKAPLDGGAIETQKKLSEAVVPVNDPRDLAERLKGIQNIPETVSSGPYQKGATQKFWVSNVDTNENFQIDAKLEYVTDHAYFWVEDGVSVNQGDLKDLAETFEKKIYPTDRQFFGSEWTPGIDDDQHLYIVYAQGLGSSLAGYFSSADELAPEAHQYSNAHEMFLLNSDTVNLSEDFTYGVLAHEFQHMIHWYRDRNEESWLNEGFSELAAFLNGYEAGGFDYVYISDPDLQLNDWPNDKDATTPHYGASFLFVTYFLDRFGEEATQALVADVQNGLDSVDQILAGLGATDSSTGKQIGADDVFADWAVANFLHDGNVGDGRYTYKNYSQAPQATESDRISDCPSGRLQGDVNQYGVDYIRITCDGNYTLDFEGSTEVGVLPENPHSGSFAFWSNKGDESDMTLTRDFDFSAVSGPVKLEYWTWYDLEEDYDFLYLEASTDGKTWKIIQTPSGTDKNISGNSYGWGYNGISDGWIKEEVDLSKYAGQKVSLRFEYVTDAAVNGEGLLLDDISIPAIDYSADFESDESGWQAQGFTRIENRLPQTYRVSLILTGKRSTTVQSLTLDENQSISVPLELGGDYNDAVLVISGTTRATRQKANYSIEVK